MALIARDLVKTYGRVIALRGASITITPGEVRGLVGENGAGKSTLLRLLAGMESPDSGTVDRSDGSCAVVPQYPRMAPSLSVLANLMVQWNTRTILLDTAGARRRVQELFRQFDISLDLFKSAGELNGTEVRFAAILAALMHRPEYLILDEPTVGLAGTDQERVLATVSALRDAGVGILFISHDLGEICRTADRISTITAGVTGAVIASPVDPSVLAERLFGKAPAPEAAPGVPPFSPPEFISTGSNGCATTSDAHGLVLEEVSLQDERSGRSLGPISFTAERGCITAITGVREAGLDLLEDYFSGRCTLLSGAVRVSSDRLPARLDPVLLRRRRVAYVPSDRFERAAALEGSVEENATVTERNAIHPRGIRLPAGVRAVTTRLLDRFGIHTEWHLPLGSLSGGTIQKLILSRELDTSPDVCILAEPTAGLDLQSQLSLRGILLDVARRGASVLILSSSIDAVTRFAGKVVVLHGGTVQGTFTGDRRDLIARAFAGLETVR